MEPRIQYARTSDGVSIAFWTLGEGMPLVVMPSIVSFIQADWQFPEARRQIERLAAGRKLIKYDRRGTGASDRDVTDVSLETQLLDLEAVVERLGLERFGLCALYFSVPAAVAYAAHRPQRVSHLVLTSFYARGSDYLDVPQVRALKALLDADWEFWSESMAQFWAGWSAGEVAHQFAAVIRDSITQETLQASLEMAGKVDVTPLLPEVRAPTLVFHLRHAPYPPLDAARALASRIPDARLVILEGGWLSLDNEAVLDAIDDFLGQGEPSPAGVEPPAPGTFRTVLFTDIEGSTAMTQRLGDAKAREVLREHERLVREALKAHGGSEIKTMGDGFMASFGSVTRAVECAIALQRAFAERNADVGAQGLAPIHIRIGLNAGEPIEEEGDLFGAAVILAARIAAQAQGGEILASLAVRELCAGKGFLFADTGDVTLKGFEDPVRLFEVRWAS